MLEMRRLLFALLPFFVLMLSSPTYAQMYSWREGASLKVANNPPGWYRADRPVRGPRVVVTQGKRVIDDTGLSMEERLRMRPLLRTKN
jgi:hypothetical protein